MTCILSDETVLTLLNNYEVIIIYFKHRLCLSTSWSDDVEPTPESSENWDGDEKLQVGEWSGVSTDVTGKIKAMTSFKYNSHPPGYFKYGVSFDCKKQIMTL